MLPASAACHANPAAVRSPLTAVTTVRVVPGRRGLDPTATSTQGSARMPVLATVSAIIADVTPAAAGTDIRPFRTSKARLSSPPTMGPS